MSETFDTSGLRITSLTVVDAAKVLSFAYGRRIDEEQVRQIADRAALIRPDDTINLLEYTAYLVRKLAHGSD